MQSQKICIWLSGKAAEGCYEVFKPRAARKHYTADKIRIFF